MNGQKKKIQKFYKRSCFNFNTISKIITVKIGIFYPNLMISDILYIGMIWILKYSLYNAIYIDI